MKKYEKIVLFILIIIGILTIVAGIYVGLHKKNIKKVFTQKDFEKVIEEDLDILLEKNSLLDITNEDITAWAFKHSEFNYSTSGFESKYLDDTIESSPFRYLDYKLTDIYAIFGNYDDLKGNNKLKCFTLKGTKYINDETCGFGGSGATPYVTKYVYYKHEKNRYIISAKSLFTTILSGPDDIRLFTSYDKARKYVTGSSSDDLSFITFKMKQNGQGVIVPYDEADKYINENWDKIKDKLDTYTYIFEVENNEIILKDFIHTSADIEEIKDKENYINNNIVIDNSDINDKLTTEQKQIVSEANYYLNESYVKPLFSYLTNSTSINDVSNNSKLWSLYELVGSDGLIKYNSEELLKELQKVFGNNFKISFEDFYCADNSQPCYTYDATTQKFIDNHNDSGVIFNSIANMKLTNFEAKDSTYYLTYNLLMIKESDSGPNAYFTNINGEEVLYNEEQKSYTTATKFNEVENKLKSVTFVFSKEDKNLILTDINK